MGKMKYVYMLMQQNRIQELEQNYKQALDAEQEHFIFDSSLIHTAKAKAIIDYANKVHIDDTINSTDV
jgi:hypothetical protein